MSRERTLWINPVAGVAGDMFVGALLHLGASLDTIREGLARLGVTGLEVSSEVVSRSGIAAVKYRVRCPGGGPGHRHWADIAGAIEGAGLDPAIADRALRVFRRLFEAEAIVHGSTPEKVHLHEAGGWDALADVVGACLALDDLGVGAIVCGPVNLGRGTVETSHGVYPVPAPATAECLRGAPVTVDGPPGEASTPTGAALVAALSTFSGSGPPRGFVLDRVGYGAGDRDPEGFANALQMHLGRCDPESGFDELVLLETNLDDCDPRVLGSIPERLLAGGARDVWMTAAQMKKGRPGTVLSVLADGERVAALRELLYRETPTLGIRLSTVRRHALPRRSETVSTQWGDVSIKVAHRGTEILNAQPEFEDCRRLAAAHDVPVREVLRAAQASWEGLEARRRSGSGSSGEQGPESDPAAPGVEREKP